MLILKDIKEDVKNVRNIRHIIHIYVNLRNVNVCAEFAVSFLD